MPKWSWILLAGIVLGCCLFMAPSGVPQWMIRIPNERDSRLFGEWKTPLRGRILTTTFNADGTLTTLGRQMEWGTSSGHLHFRYRSNHGWLGKRVKYPFAEDGRSINLGNDYIGLPLDLVREPQAPIIAVGRFRSAPSEEMERLVEEHGLDLSGDLIQVTKDWAVIGRDICRSINEDSPGTIEVLYNSDEPNNFPTFPHVRIEE